MRDIVHGIIFGAVFFGFCGLIAHEIARNAIEAIRALRAKD